MSAARDRLSGRVALVTGCGRGIGRAIALRLASEGADVVCNDLDAASAAAVADEVERLGSRSLVAPVDVSSREQVETCVARALERFGVVDVLVNNAGIYRLAPEGKGPVEAETEESWDRVLAVNLKGVLFCSQAVLPSMKARRLGRIVNIGSLAGKLGGVASVASYAVSKAGVLCLTKILAKEGAPYGITANAVAPGQIDTEMTAEVARRWPREQMERAIPLGRLGTAEDVAAAAAFLASDDAAYLTGEVLDVNGGLLMD